MREQLLNLSHFAYERQRLQLNTREMRALCEELIDWHGIADLKDPLYARQVLRDKLDQHRAMLINLGALPPSPKNYGIRRK